MVLLTLDINTYFDTFVNYRTQCNTICKAVILLSYNPNQTRHRLLQNMTLSLTMSVFCYREAVGVGSADDVLTPGLVVS